MKQQGSSPQKARTSKKVLIADDVAFFRNALKEILLKGGFEVVGEAENGAEALKMARDLRPDIVILDVIMPEKSGLETARELTYSNLPLKIIICTSLKHESIMEEAVRAGASAYINKPLDPTEVLNILNNLRL